MKYIFGLLTILFYLNLYSQQTGLIRLTVESDLETYKIFNELIEILLKI